MTTIVHAELIPMTTTTDTTSIATTSSASTPKWMLWTGRVLTGLITAFMVFGGIVNLLKPQFVIEGTKQSGFAESTIVPLGVTVLIISILYAVPRTAVLGAILLTGYFGGAVATHVRLGDGMLLVPAVFGVLVWLGVYFRDARLRALVPLRRD